MNSKFRILVCGDRLWMDYLAIRNKIKSYHTESMGVECIIEGECQGADTFARIAAEELKIPVLKFPADWTQYGKAAGPIRNKQMIEEGQPNLVLAFHDNFEHSKGTKNMILQAKAHNIDCRLYYHSLDMKFL